MDSKELETLSGYWAIDLFNDLGSLAKNSVGDVINTGVSFVTDPAGTIGHWVSKGSNLIADLTTSPIDTITRLAGKVETATESDSERALRHAFEASGYSSKLAFSLGANLNLATRADAQSFALAQGFTSADDMLVIQKGMYFPSKLSDAEKRRIMTLTGSPSWTSSESVLIWGRQYDPIFPTYSRLQNFNSRFSLGTASQLTSEQLDEYKSHVQTSSNSDLLKIGAIAGVAFLLLRKK